MTDEIRICVLANSGLGGTEKAATIFAVGLVARGFPVDYLGDGGPRESYLKKHGVHVIHVGRDSSAVRAYIEDVRPKIVHQHVPGYPTDNPLYGALAQLPRHLRPKVIETNVFGRLDDSQGDEVVDFRFFISAASAAQAFRRRGLRVTAQNLKRQSVLYYPVIQPEVSGLTIDKSLRRDFRSELKVREEEILAVRVGRPGHKWAAWECKSYRIAKKKSPRLRLFLMEPPWWLSDRIATGKYGEGIIVRKETRDFTWLEKLYAAADLMIHASDWGESFGYTVGEAMAAGLPVITRSTPWCDNAQVELVKNAETGFVCWSVPEMARRMVDLAEDGKLREKMGIAGQERILGLCDLRSEMEILEEAIKHLLALCPLNAVGQRNTRLLEFVEKFPSLEKETSESPRAHPLDFFVASIYSMYRSVRSSIRAMIDRVRWKRRPTANSLG